MVFEFLTSYTNTIAIAVILGLLISLMLPKKIHYVINGFLLLSIGITHLLFEFGFINFNVRQTPILLFVIAFVVATTSKELIAESIRERGIMMKGLAFITGIALISLVLIPELYHLGAINFNIPDYPFIVNAIIYVVAGLVAIFSPFFVN